MATEQKCANGHEWSNEFGDDWTPAQGTRCDCGQKQWGIPLTKAHTAQKSTQQNWAAKAARHIVIEYGLLGRFGDKIASIISTHAEPLIALLREAKREHKWEEDDKCDKLNKIDPAEKICTCGADEWNRRVDEVLNHT